ncbi:unnamed protein product [Clonostachys solani]|uniref:Uncharacterized protein n=1 Tax=Clonostachys solani TaxID=160281 RepID=A0A9N9ZQ29_9HYPO|nr:unnamed protein product [Clonostachys solani]
MSILSLPNELIHLLLINCILFRGVVRGLRLRLVCKRFNECFIPALYNSRILDDVSAPQIGRHWWMRDDQHGPNRLWQQYLVARVLGEADPERLIYGTFTPPPWSKYLSSLPIISIGIFANQYFSRTPAIYDFITDSFSYDTNTETDKQIRQRNQIAQYARYGNVVMVRHVSGPSSKIRGGTRGRYGNPLYQACRGGYEDIVDFLLDRDVDHHGQVLNAATRAGSVEIVRKILEREITFETDFTPREILTEVIKCENLPMLHLILEQGYNVTLGRYDEAMEMAVAQGLESMIDCLRGLEIVEDPPYFSNRTSHGR